MHDLLIKIFENNDALAAVLFCASAGAGQVMHALKKWADGESSSLAGWFTSNIKRTIGAMLGNLMGMIVFVQTGVLGPMISLPNGWWAIFLFGFMNGFSTDSALNKSARTEWTQEERAAKEAKDAARTP